MINLKELFLWPQMHSGALKVWSRNFLYFKKTWMVSVFWIVLEPVIYLGAIGFGRDSLAVSVWSVIVYVMALRCAPGRDETAGMMVRMNQTS